MKARRLFPVVAAAALSSALLLCGDAIPADGQGELPEFAEGGRLDWDAANGVHRFHWRGRADRTYFLQTSPDLAAWIYLPIIEPGDDSEKEWAFSSAADRFFIRLRPTEQTAADPWAADFDGDGAGNLAELEAGTDPLLAAHDDSDGDGLSNMAEALAGTDPASPDTDGDSVSDADEDADGDGATNGTEILFGTDPASAPSVPGGPADAWRLVVFTPLR